MYFLSQTISINFNIDLPIIYKKHTMYTLPVMPAVFWRRRSCVCLITDGAAVLLVKYACLPPDGAAATLLLDTCALLSTDGASAVLLRRCVFLATDGAAVGLLFTWPVSVAADFPAADTGDNGFVVFSQVTGSRMGEWVGEEEVVDLVVIPLLGAGIGVGGTTSKYLFKTDTGGWKYNNYGIF